MFFICGHDSRQFPQLIVADTGNVLAMVSSASIQSQVGAGPCSRCSVTSQSGSQPQYTFTVIADLSLIVSCQDISKRNPSAD